MPIIPNIKYLIKTPFFSEAQAFRPIISLNCGPVPKHLREMSKIWPAANKFLKHKKEGHGPLVPHFPPGKGIVLLRSQTFPWSEGRCLSMWSSFAWQLIK